ncbi:MAG TPA: AI-2E family transporter, partial [Armatimonadota bacterium]|nr:AI-2E family transporter [Armatimonadota bacterium]
MKSFIERAMVVWVILAALLIGLGVVYSGWWLLSRAAVVILMVVLAVFLALVLDPVVERISRRMPRWAAVALVYVGIAALMALLGILIVPLLIRQGKEFADWIRNPTNPLVQFTTWALDPARHPELRPHPTNPILSRIDSYIMGYHTDASRELQDAVNKRIAELKDYAGALVGSIVNAALRGLGWVFRGFLVMVISIYLLLDKSRFLEWFRSTVSPARRAQLERLFHDMVEVLSAYLRGLAMMVLFVGGAVTLLLLFTGIKYWLFIGCLAGILEVIPYFGAIGGAIP